MTLPFPRLKNFFERKLRAVASRQFKLHFRKKTITLSLPILFWMGFTFLSVTAFFTFVDLRPKVDENFFFSSDDPQFREDKLISEIFPQPPQIIIGARGDIRSPSYAEKIEEISSELASLPEVFSVQSLTRGPDDLKDAFKSPLWKRVLTANDGESTFISVFIKEVSAEIVVPKIEKMRDQFHQPGFQLMISGAPYITEMIRSHLMRDLQVFSLAAFVVFGIVLFMIFRSTIILLGTLIACLNSSAATLILTHLLRIPIGPLTANLSTMVFVLTLSPMVFITFNWRHLRDESETRGSNPAREAVKMTFHPSFWSMATTLAGFISLLFVQASPLRQLGIAGAIGTFVAFASAYLIYPWFLEMAVASDEKRDKLKSLEVRLQLFSSKAHGGIVAFLGVLILVGATGLTRVNTDPDLFSYFKKGDELRDGLEYIDRNGGSSPFKLVVVNQDSKESFATGEAYKRLWSLHEALEKDPMVGNVVSLPIVLAEAKSSPLTFFLSTEWLLNIMESPRFGEIAKYFVTEDRKKSFFLLRMREMGRKGSRLEVIERVKSIVESQGFVPDLVGGAYLLQAKLSALLTSSLISGLTLLVFTFAMMGWFLSRSIQISAALMGSLAMIPIVLLGFIGYLKLPLDVIAAPAANLAIGMGVDAMIYVLFFVRRHQKKGSPPLEIWAKARSELWQPIATNMIVICAGFGIFFLSSFPPTQRFGFSVVFGSLTSAFAALFLFPWLGSLPIPDKITQYLRRKDVDQRTA